MTLYDEYCYNLMESAIKAGAEGHGIPKESCAAYMNIMAGVRGAEQYIKDNCKESEDTEDGKEMGD